MFASLWKFFWAPTQRYTVAAIFIVGGIGGVIFWGGFNTAMEATNTLEFCLSCHEMNDNVGAEYKASVHYQNRSGVRATCSDCHVPDPWVHKVVRKVQASNELLHKVLGTIDTPDKFEDKRLTLAKNVWKAMKESDSRECRNCHSWDAMLEEKQKRRAWKRHSAAKEEGATCIDCHKGIAHRSVHKLLDEDDNPYDGKPDDRRLPPKEDVVDEASAEPVATEVAVEQPSAASTSTADSGDWEGVPVTDVALLYPGQASLEWVLKGSDHGGGRAVRRAGDRCSECHKGEQMDMGAKIVTGEKVEPTPIPGKRGGIAMTVQAKHDGENISFRFQWPDTDHTPTPFAEGGKMDADNQIKLAMMFDDGKVEMAEQVGCWVSCHHDSRYMPDTPDAGAMAAFADMISTSDGITKYTKGSRTELEYKGKNGKPRGAWDKLIPPEELSAKLAEGAFMDMIRFKSGNGGETEAGYVLADRQLAPNELVQGTGNLENGTWTVTITRPLAATQPGGVAFETGKTYTIGFAIHDDHTTARFHHVSLEYRLALDTAEAEINVVKK
jgi:nitrate/TMAO reductase-like tetraheme cytochrome c subunit